MRRGSLKKSSNFKIQTEKTVFKEYLNNIDKCKTAQLYPHLTKTIKSTSQALYENCYSYSDSSPFIKGLNYGCKNYGFSSQSATTVVYKEWLPQIKQAYLLGEFNNFNENSHPLELSEQEDQIFQIQIDIERQKLIQESKILLRIIDKEGKQYKIAPPSCYMRSGQYGIYCMDLSIPKSKKTKKQQILLGYTLDLKQIPIEKAEQWIQTNLQMLSDFNTIIIRNLFQFSEILKISSLQIQRMKKFYDLVNTIKDTLGFKIVLEWVFIARYENQPTNPLQKNLLIKSASGNYWVNDFQNKQAIGFYLSKISFYLSTFMIDGFHFKEIDSVIATQQGQILVKYINVMHQRLLENSFALVSCKKYIPGLNQPILQGGLGFTYSYNYGQDFLNSESHKQLKEKFDNISLSSNCVPINLDSLNKKHVLNFIFTVLVSEKGIFCKGKVDQFADVLKKIIRVRKQYELFTTPAKVIKINQKLIYLKRGKTHALFNFSSEQIHEVIENVQGHLQVLYSSNDEQSLKDQQCIKLEGNTCCILQQIIDS